MDITNACLILISILILIYVNYIFVNKELFIDYNSYISIPTSAYDKAFQVGSKKYFVEFGDKFFKDALDKNLYNQSFNYDGFIEMIDYNASDIKAKVSSAVENILNRFLPIEDTNLFNVVNMDIVKLQKNDTKYVVTANSLIHRLEKAYGLSLQTKTYHEPGNSSLLEYKIIGFVFEDKMNTSIVEPSNLNSSDELTYEQVMKTTIIRDKKYEQDTFCKYITDLKKYRNIDVPDGKDCNTV